MNTMIMASACSLRGPPLSISSSIFFLLPPLSPHLSPTSSPPLPRLHDPYIFSSFLFHLRSIYICIYSSVDHSFYKLAGNHGVVAEQNDWKGRAARRLPLPTSSQLQDHAMPKCGRGRRRWDVVEEI